MPEITNITPDVENLPSAIVIGSGFGGAVTACRLSQAGFKVLVLERGRRYGDGDFPALPEAPSFLPDTRRWTWNNDQGLWDVVDLGDVVAVQAAGYGGGSLVYANVHLRPAPEVFDEKWPDAYRGGAVLKQYYDLVAAMLDVAPLDQSAKLSATTTKCKGMKDAARGLGRHDDFFHPPLAINYEPFPNNRNGFGAPQRACNGCGACCTGCPIGAKNTLDLNYLAAAEANGVDVRTQCEATDIAHVDGLWEVTCTDHLEARKLVLRAKLLFLCAGSVHSTELLARSDPRRCGVRRAAVGSGYFPGADAIGIVYDTTTPQEPSNGPTITTATVHWNSVKPASYFLIQDGGYPAELERLFGFMQGSIWLGRNRLTRSQDPGHRPPAPAPKRQPTPPGPRPQSALDDVIDAVRGGAFLNTISPRQRAMVLGFMAQLKELLALPDLVHGTLERNVWDRYARTWPTNRFDPKSWLMTKFRAVEASCVRSYCGGDDQLADEALRSIEALGDQSLDELVRRAGWTAEGAPNRLMLLAMGRDSAGGVLEYHRDEGRMLADLDLYRLAGGYANQERLMSDIANKLGGELRVNPMWSILGRPITVHSQGGCPMSDDPEKGVTDPYGRVYGCQNLFVLDGSILCQSVGVNPSATIAAIAERNIHAFIAAERGEDWWRADTPGARQYRSHLERKKEWLAKAKGWHLSPPVPQRAPVSRDFESESVGIEFTEGMEGYYGETHEDPDELYQRPAERDAAYRRLESAGAPAHPLRVDLHVWHPNLSEFLEDQAHQLFIDGYATMALPKEGSQRHRVRGKLELLVPLMDDDIDDERQARREVHAHYTRGRVRLRSRKGTSPPGEPRLEQTRHRGAVRELAADPDTRFMRYELTFVDREGLSLVGYKRISDKPQLEAWRDVTCLFVKLKRGHQVFGAGAIHIEVFDFLEKQIPSIHATGTTDPARWTWATQAFVRYFFGSLQRIYVPEISKAFDTVTPGVSSRRRGAHP